MKVGILQPSTTSRRRQVVQASPRGQVTLPISVRRALAIHTDTLLDVTVDRGRVVLAPLRPSVSADQLRTYSDHELKQFLRDDQLSPADQQFVQRLVSR